MQIFKQTLALALTLVMVFSLLPVGAFAAEHKTAPEVHNATVSVQEQGARSSSVPVALAGEVSVTAAAEGTCGEDLTWSLSEDGILTISGTGPMADYASASEAPWYSQRESVKAVVLEDDVTTIGDRAFYNCTALTDVSIGSSVAVIGTYAFRGCTVLEAVTIPANVTELKDSAFRACTALNVVTFEGNAPALGNYVFNDGAAALTIQHYEGSAGYDASPWIDYTLKALHVGQWVVDVPATCTTDGSRHIDCTYCGVTITETIPSGHQYVDGICAVCQDVEILGSGSCGTDVTWKLDALGTLIISGSGKMMHFTSYDVVCWSEYREYINSVVVESGVTSISTYAFYRCKNLTNVMIPDSVTSIGHSVFSYCYSLSGIIVDERNANYSSDSYGVLYDKEKIELIKAPVLMGNHYTIPESVSKVGDEAFYGCDKIVGITMPNGVSEIGDKAFFYCSSLINITIPDSVTEIGEYAFAGCSSLSSIVIPDGVSRIDRHVFTECSGLTDITIPESVTAIGDYAFSQCSSLCGITIPDSVTSIGENAFWDCDNLTSITIGEAVTSIGKYAFDSCGKLTDVNIRDVAAWLGISFERGSDESFYGVTANPLYANSYDKKLYLNGKLITDLIIPEGVTEVGQYAFYRCSRIYSVHFPNGMTTIGENAFFGCSVLTQVYLPKSITNIERDAFGNCSPSEFYIADVATWIDCSHAFQEAYDRNLYLNGELITDLIIPEGIARIPSSAFINCHDLRSVTIGENVTWIGGKAFYGCDGLARIEIPSSLSEIGADCFYGCNKLTDIYIEDIKAWLGILCRNDWNANPLTANYLDKNLYLNGEIITELVIPDGVTKIGFGAFYLCTNLISITLPESVTSLGKVSFLGCDNVLTLTLMDGVESIGDSAFYGCNALTSVSIPKSVKNIGQSSFNGCSNLLSVTIMEGVECIGDMAFYGCGNLTNVSIPKSVISIGHSVFYSCGNLKDIYYGGTKAEWQLLNTTVDVPFIHYSCINPEGHWVSESAEATCEVDGYTRESCNCGHNRNIVTYPKLGHEMSEWITIKKVTCTEAGINQRECIRCGHIETEEIFPRGHNYSYHSIVPATCIEQGYTTHICVNCGDSYVDTYVDALGHAMGQWWSVKEATCTEDGLRERRCTRCAYYEAEVIPADGHDYVSVVRAPTCTEQGYTTHTCSCGDSYVDSYVDALGHAMGQWETTKEATCTEKGAKERKCSRCDHTETEEIDALGHDHQAVVTAPTCTEKGYTTHTCSRCSDSYVDTYVDALGHDMGQWKITKEATCTEKGTEQRQCSRCDHTETEEISALGHDYESVVTAPTCTEKGYTTHTCSCGDSYVDSYVDALGHDMGQWETTKEPTCTEKGTKERKCSRCDHTETEEIAALGHDHQAVVTAPTCTEKGYTTHTCSRCSDSYVDTYVDALGHDMGQWETTKEPTCTEKGEKERKCSRCAHSETGEISAKGHDYQAAVTEPTCETQGYTTYTCSNCGDSYVSDYTDPVDHVYEDGHCKWCGKAQVYAKIISYSTSLGGNIAMNFYVELSEDLVADPNAYIQFSFAGKTVNVPLCEGIPTGTSYRFACPITSKNMTDDITAQVYNADGPVGDPKTMAVDTYCNWIIANTRDQKTINLMKAMLNYGASAQMLFNYRTDDLANAALAEADKTFGKVDASAFIHSRVGEEDGIKPTSYTLLLDSETTVRCYFELTGDKSIEEFTFMVDGEEVTPVYKDGYYYIEKANIAAHRLDDMHTFTCGNITITYGGLSYVNQVMTYYTSGTTFDMASALYAYSKAAEAYIG